MKKFSIFIILIIVCIFCFAGCVNTPNTASDLGDCNVGYEFEVYPNVEFNYKISDDFIVHISDISVTLVQKNEIKANDTIENIFMPYVVKLEVSGFTTAEHCGTRIRISFSSITTGLECYATITEDGTFYGDSETSFRNNNTIYFSRIMVS